MFFIILKKKLILLEEFILNSISIDRMEKQPCHSLSSPLANELTVYD